MKDGTPYYDLYVGSSNLTGAALTTQREWNLKVSSLADGELVGQFQDEIDSQVADSVPLTEEWIKQYEEDFKKYAPPRHEILQSFEGHDIQPNAMQQEALANLKKLREQGEHRAIIVSATGTGKTYLSAFDVRECQPKRMLYIAQQQMILQTAMNSYQKVMNPNWDCIQAPASNRTAATYSPRYRRCGSRRFWRNSNPMNSTTFWLTKFITLEPKDISASSIISKMPTSCSA